MSHYSYQVFFLNVLLTKSHLADFLKNTSDVDQ